MTHASNLHGMPLLAFWRRANQERDTLGIPRSVLDLVRVRHAASLASLAATRDAEGNPCDTRDFESVLVLPDLDLHLAERPAWHGRGSAEPLADALATILASESLRARLADPLCFPGRRAGPAAVAAALAHAQAKMERDMAWEAAGVDPTLVMNEIAARTARRWPVYLGPAALAAVVALSILSYHSGAPRPRGHVVITTAYNPSPIPRRGEELVVSLEPGRAHFATLVLARGSQRVRQDLVRSDPADEKSAYVSQREASQGLVQLALDTHVVTDPIAPEVGIDWFTASMVCRRIAAGMSSSPYTVRLPRPDEWPTLQRLRTIQAVQSRGLEWLADGPATYGRHQASAGELSLHQQTPPQDFPRATSGRMSFRLVIARR